MKDKNGIDTECYNCAIRKTCKEIVHRGVCEIGLFLPSKEAYEDRIEDLQNEINIIQASERAEAQEADRLRAEVEELKSHNEVLQKRVEEFSMELLDRIMRDNKDVLERLKQAESEDNYENFDIERDYD